MKTKNLLLTAVASLALVNTQAQITAEFSAKDSKYAYEQNFDALPDTNRTTSPYYYTYINSGSEGALTIPGWYVTHANATPTYGTGLKCDNGSFFTGTSIFSYGSETLNRGGIGGTNRTLGAIAGKNGFVYLGVLLKNNTGSTVKTMTVKFAGETWRKGCEVNKADGSLTCDIIYNPIFADATNYYITPDQISLGTNIREMDYASSLTGAADATAQGATGLNVDGHATENRTLKSYTSTDMNWPANATLLIRWRLNNVPYDASNNVYAQWGLGIDDFSATIDEVVPTSLENQKVETFKVYKDGQSLCVNGTAGEIIEIYNSCGQLVKTLTLSGKEETVSGLNKDVLYLLKGKNSTVKVLY